MYGPVCTVVWEGRGREASPYPDYRGCGPALSTRLVSIRRSNIDGNRPPPMACSPTENSTTRVARRRRRATCWRTRGRSWTCRFTDIALQDGEQLVGSGPVAGDTVRWVIGDTESGAGAAKKTHNVVKPTRADLMTNLVNNTDQRTYHPELRLTEKTYMASVSWEYPQDELLALRRQNVAGDSRRPSMSGSISPI